MVLNIEINTVKAEKVIELRFNGFFLLLTSKDSVLQ